jgi:hypothetical protein
VIRKVIISKVSIFNSNGTVEVFQFSQTHFCELPSTLCHLEQVLFLAINGGYVNRFQAYLMYLQAHHSEPKARCVAAKVGISENLL